MSEEQTYIVRKLGRKANPANQSPPAVRVGRVFDGVPARGKVFDYDLNAEIPNEGLSFVPKIGKCASINCTRWNSGNNWLRTSTIEDFYIHEDYENSKDKIVLANPEDGKLIEGVKFGKGDILLQTMNSMYYLQTVQNALSAERDNDR